MEVAIDEIPYPSPSYLKLQHSPYSSSSHKSILNIHTQHTPSWGLCPKRLCTNHTHSLLPSSLMPLSFLFYHCDPELQQRAGSVSVATALPTLGRPWWLVRRRSRHPPSVQGSQACPDIVHTLHLRVHSSPAMCHRLSVTLSGSGAESTFQKWIDI